MYANAYLTPCYRGGQCRNACGTLEWMKLSISIGVLVFSSLGGWVGQTMDHGNWLGGWSIILSGVGGIVGIWLGYKVGKNYF